MIAGPSTLERARVTNLLEPTVLRSARRERLARAFCFSVFDECLTSNAARIWAHRHRQTSAPTSQAVCRMFLARVIQEMLGERRVLTSL